MRLFLSLPPLAARFGLRFRFFNATTQRETEARIDERPPTLRNSEFLLLALPRALWFLSLWFFCLQTTWRPLAIDSIPREMRFSHRVIPPGFEPSLPLPSAPRVGRHFTLPSDENRTFSSASYFRDPLTSQQCANDTRVYSSRRNGNLFFT